MSPEEPQDFRPAVGTCPVQTGRFSQNADMREPRLVGFAVSPAGAALAGAGQPCTETGGLFGVRTDPCEGTMQTVFCVFA